MSCFQGPPVKTVLALKERQTYQCFEFLLEVFLPQMISYNCGGPLGFQSTFRILISFEFQYILS